MIKILVNNQFKRNRISNFKFTKKNIFGFISLFILTISLLTLLGFIVYQVTETFYRLELEDVYLTTVFFILILVLTIFETINIIKQLYLSNDNQIYFKLPIKKEEIFLSKIIYIYLKQVLISLIFLFVTAFIYGLVSDKSVYYYLKLVIISILLPLFPLLFATIISIPLSSIIKYLKRNKILLLISLIITISLLFIGYIFFINIILKFINITTSGTNYLSIEKIEIIKNSINNLKISKLFYILLISNPTNFFIKLLYLIIIITILTIISYYLLKYFYFKIINNQNEKRKYCLKRNIKIKKPLKSILIKEIKILIRNPNYAFQTIIINILMPLFIILTIKLTKEAGELKIGKEIIPGVTFLTFLIFILLANCFQGTIISREKNSYYISKIIPVNKIKQLLIRISFGFILNIIMISISMILLLILNYINLKDGLLIYILSIIFLIGYTSYLVEKDYKNPNLDSLEGGLDEGLNLYNNLLYGLIITVFLGMLYIIVPYFQKLFPITRTFKILGFIIISLNEKTANILLYSIIIITILLYSIRGIIKFIKVVKK